MVNIFGSSFIYIYICGHKVQLPPPSYTMKRCNNCGWFNQDSVLSCEKCCGETFEIEEEPEEVTSTSVVVANDVESVAADQCELEKNETKQSLNKFAKSTVAINSDLKSVENISSNIGKFARSTVSIDSDVPSSVSLISSIFTSKSTKEQSKEMEMAAPQPAQSITCDKCCYPISGYVEYCPNCGVAIKNVDMLVPAMEQIEEGSMAVSSGEAESGKAASINMKKTVNESIEEPMADDVVYRLIPMDILSEAVIELRVGDVVMIRGERFKFDR